MLNNSQANLIGWPPVYQVRQSARAKRPFLQVTRERGLEVVLPIRKRRIDVEKILNDKRAWVERTLHKMFQRLPLLNKDLLEIPQFIECQAISETWEIRYQPRPLAKKLTSSLELMPHKVLILKGKTDDIMLCQRTIKKYLMKEANRVLIPWLKDLGFLTGLSFNRAIIRGQSTLWGSCNAHKTISLNYKLLFFPNRLVKHVLLHELCHTKHLDHSKNFWQLLKHWDEDCHENRLDLKSAERFVPNWL